MRKEIKRHGQYYVYIVKCANETYYTGYTSNIEKRIKAHNNNRGAKYLKGKQPIELVYAKPYAYYKNALKGEKEIKKLTRQQKANLIKDYQEEIE